MFSIHDKPARLCDGLSRRELLRVGGLGAFGLSAGQLSSARGESLATENPAGLPGFGKARSCIVLFLLGGPPQHETWDPKPHAPAEIRGDFQPIASAIPGLHVGEMMPKTLFDTTLNPATRRLLQVVIPDGAQVETELVLSRLMGKDSAPRYEEIMERARTVEALDV